MRGHFKISILPKYIISIPDETGQETNEYFSSLLDKYSTNILKRGWKVYEDGDFISADVKSLTVDEFLLLMQFGGRAYNFAPGIKVEAININDAIPEGLPNRTYVNEDEETIVHTWSSWHDDMHINFTYSDGSILISSMPFSTYLSDSVLLTIHNSPGVQLTEGVQ